MTQGSSSRLIAAVAVVIVLAVAWDALTTHRRLPAVRGPAVAAPAPAADTTPPPPPPPPPAAPPPGTKTHPQPGPRYLGQPPRPGNPPPAPPGARAAPPQPLRARRP